MKQGLLLKEAPETINLFNCWDCPAKFFDTYLYQKHRKEKHNEVYSFRWEPPFNYELKGKKVGETRPGYFVKCWCSVGDAKGRMQIPYSIGVRPQMRWKVTLQEIQNLAEGKCWYGKPKSKWAKYKRKYCSDKCSHDWYYIKTVSWGNWRSHVIYKRNKKGHITPYDNGYYWVCVDCKVKITDESRVELDHITAIVLGGHPWDERNLQILCDNCHKIKTKSDMGILAWWRTENKYYDISFKVENIVTLEAFV